MHGADQGQAGDLFQVVGVDAASAEATGGSVGEGQSSHHGKLSQVALPSRAVLRERVPDKGVQMIGVHGRVVLRHRSVERPDSVGPFRRA
ncbi:hypothetical protein GCM10009810_32870 [Nostocoides vanveenii]|uniref:Uncharacterized protein n=1 Tax=Nostocoides vanveenii TaxID=330835 RepID=A0ABN2L2P7_9MICO